MNPVTLLYKLPTWCEIYFVFVYSTSVWYEKSLTLLFSSRTHFHYEPNGKSELSFRSGDIFRVVDTLHNGVVGAWQVCSITEYFLSQQDITEHLLYIIWEVSNRYALASLVFYD